MMRIVEGSSARENSPIDPFGGAKGFDLYAGDTKKERIEVSGEISEKAQKSLITRLPAGRQGV